MSLYIGNDLEDRLEALEAKNTLLKEYNECRQIVDEIDHMSDLHLDSSFYKRSMKLDKYVKIEEWFDSSLGQSTVIQRLDLKRPTLSKQTQNKRKYVNFENGSHFICSFNLNNSETTVCIVFKMTNIASGDQLFVLFINDLPSVVNSYIKIFADDTKIFAGIKDENDTLSLQDDLYNLHNWLNKWQLNFNIGKCKLLHIRKKIQKKSTSCIRITF